nr:hypothetical protein [Tanacetum cinerariifolium]
MQGKKMPQSAPELSSMMLCVYPVAGLSMIHAEENIQVHEITKLIWKYADVFAVPTSLLPERAFDHKIVLKEGVVPVNVNVVDGNKLLNISVCKKITWQLQGEIFKTDAMLVPLGVVKWSLGFNGWLP